MNVTLKDLVEFIEVNRRGKAFFKHTREDIIQELTQCIELNTLGYSFNPVTQKVNGVVTGSVIPEQNVFYVTNILATERFVMFNLLRKFCAMFPGYHLEARRKGIIKKYNTVKFIGKVNSLTLKGAI